MWLLLGLSSGLFHALQNMVSKKALKGTNQYLAAFAYAAFSLPFLLISLVWFDWAPTNFAFWWSNIATSILNVIGLIILMKALKIGELSLTIPFLAFTPIFLILTSGLMLGEFPNSIGILGIIAIVCGTYLLETKKNGGIWGPWKAFKENKAGQLVMLVAFIYAISSNLDKIAVQNSNPITKLIIGQLLMILMFIPIIYFKSDQKLSEIKHYQKYFWPIGLLVALTLMAQMTAITLNMVSYIISLKRTSVLFSVILGAIAFKERNIKPKLIGSSLMVAGVFLISIS